MSERARRIPIPRLDRLWLGSSFITTIGPIDVPTRKSILQAFVTLAATGPAGRIGLRFADRSRTHWDFRPDDLLEYAESCVVQLPPGSDDDLDGLLSRLADDHGSDDPIRVFLADRHVLVMISHALGDSRLGIALPFVIVTLSQGGPLPTWATTPVSRRPMVAALRNTFADRARVSALLAAWRATQAARRSVHEPDEGPAVRQFRPSAVAVTEAGRPGQTRELQRWTRRNAPGAAHFATVLTATVQALTDNGITCAPLVHMVYDLHRYLPRAHHTTGNFVGGVDLPLPANNPVELTDMVTRAAKSGHPLAALAAAITRPRVQRPDRRHTPRLIPDAPHARLALSYIGPKSVEQDIPWSAPPTERMYWSRVDPAGPSAMTLLVAIIGERLMISASFHSTVFDPGAVRQALRDVHADPIGLVERAMARADGRPVR